MPSAQLKCDPAAESTCTGKGPAHFAIQLIGTPPGMDARARSCSCRQRGWARANTSFSRAVRAATRAGSIPVTPRPPPDRTGGDSGTGAAGEGAPIWTRSGRRPDVLSAVLQTGELLGGEDEVRGGGRVDDRRRSRGAGDRQHDVGLREVPGQGPPVDRDPQLIGPLRERGRLCVERTRRGHSTEGAPGQPGETYGGAVRQL